MPTTPKNPLYPKQPVANNIESFYSSILEVIHKTLAKEGYNLTWSIKKQKEVEVVRETTGAVPKAGSPASFGIYGVQSKEDYTARVEDDPSRNNGGTTDYYALPFAPSERYPEPTLNDLIEYKEMSFARGESVKALYALDERAKREANGSILRELYKVRYYTSRMIRLHLPPT